MFEFSLSLLGGRLFLRFRGLLGVDRLFNFRFFLHRIANVFFDIAGGFLELFHCFPDAAGEFGQLLSSEEKDEDDENDYDLGPTEIRDECERIGCFHGVNSFELIF